LAVVLLVMVLDERFDLILQLAEQSERGLYSGP